MAITHRTQSVLPDDPSAEVSSNAWDESHDIDTLDLPVLSADPSPSADTVKEYVIDNGQASPNRVVTRKALLPDGTSFTIWQVTIALLLVIFLGVNSAHATPVNWGGNTFTGTSSDTKPTNVPDGSRFHETDTKKIYIKTGGSWAESTDYNVLSNKPTIPAAQVNSDWNAGIGAAQILNKPSLAPIATSGNLSDATDDISHRTVTDTEKATWNSKESPANKDQHSGYAGLDSSGLLLPAEFPTADAVSDNGVDWHWIWHTAIEDNCSGLTGTSLSSSLLTIHAGNTSVDVGSGSGHINDHSFTAGTYADIDWTSQNVSCVGDGTNYVAVDENGTVAASLTKQVMATHVYLGHFYCQSGNVIEVFNVPEWAGHFPGRINEWLGHAVGGLVAEGLEVSEQANPNYLKIQVNAGEFYTRLSEITTSTITTFIKMYNSTSGWQQDSTSANTVNTTQYNDPTQSSGSALVTMTDTYWKKDMMIMTPAGHVYYMYAQSQYATQDAAKQAPLPAIPSEIATDSVYLVAIVSQKGDSSIANRILDIRPSLPRVFGYGTTAGGAVIAHNTLLNLDYASSGHTGFQQSITGGDCSMSGGTITCTKTNGNAFATVATSGSYTNLSSKPVIPGNEAGASNNFLTAYDNTTGAFSKAQPSCSSLSNSGTGCSSAAATTKSCTGTDKISAYDSSTGTFTCSTDQTSAGGSYNTIQEEGSSLTQRSTINFVGSTITCADDTTRTTCTVDAAASNASTTVAGQTCALGGSCPISSTNLSDSSTIVTASRMDNVFSTTGLLKRTGAATYTTDTTTYAATDQTMYIGTTAVAINRASASLSLAGVNIDGSASTATTATKSTNLIGGNSTTLLGAIPYQSNTDTTTLLGPNTTSTAKVLTMTGTGTNGAVPAWNQISSSYVDTSIAKTGTDINTSNQVTATHLTAYLPEAQGGTGAAALTCTNQVTTSNGTAYSCTSISNAMMASGSYIKGVFHTFCTGTVTASVTYYNFPGFGSSTTACTGVSTAAGGTKMTSAGTIKNMYVNLSAAGKSGDKIQMYKNGVTTGAPTCTYGTATTCSDTSSALTVAAGDVITIATTSGTSDGSANLAVSFELWN